MMVVLKRKTLDVVVYDGEIGNNMVLLRYWVLILPLFSLANGKWNGENVAHGIEKRM